MPRSQKENERIKEEKIDRILVAGLKVFAEKGLASAKMSDIAKTANISYGLVYNYFPSKEDIFTRILNDSFLESKEFVAEVSAKNLSSLQSIKTIFYDLFYFHATDEKGELYYRMILQLNFYPKLWEKLTINDFSSEPVIEYLFELVKDGQKSGEIVGSDPKEIVMLLGNLISTISLKTHEMIGDNIDVEKAVNLIIRMIKK